MIAPFVKRARQIAAEPRIVVYWAKFVSGDLMLRLALRLRHPALIALAWRIYLNRSALHHPATVAARIAHIPRARRTLIVLDRSGGNEDVEEAFAGATADYRLRFLNRDAVKRVYACFVPAGAGDDDHYLSADPQVQDARRQYREGLVAVLSWYRRWFGEVAFLQFNLYYYAEVELAAACAACGIPFLTAQKECLRPARAWRDVEPQLRETRGAFAGTAISVYNAACAEAFVRAGIVAPARVTVVGCARMDASHRVRALGLARTTQPTVVYYLIDPRASAPLYRRADGRWVRGFFDADGREYTWAPLIEQVNSAVLTYATARPDVRFICKGKSGFSDVQLAAFGGRLPANVDVAKDFPGHVLLTDAWVVIGFNSTAVFEALAAGVPTIVPCLWAHVDAHLRHYTYDLAGAADCPTTGETLVQALDSALGLQGRRRDLSARQRAVLDEHLGNADGHAGRRLKAWLDAGWNSRGGPSWHTD